MLECGQNYKGSMNLLCKTCKVVDDESHRLNECTMYREKNCTNQTSHINFNDIYSHESSILSNVIMSIEQLWNTKTAHGSMKP